MNWMNACSSLILALTVAACGAPPTGGGAGAGSTEHDDTAHAPTPKLPGKVPQEMCANCDKGDDTGGGEGDDDVGDDDDSQPIGEGNNGNPNDPDPAGASCFAGQCFCNSRSECEIVQKQGKCHGPIRCESSGTNCMCN